MPNRFVSTIVKHPVKKAEKIGKVMMRRQWRSYPSDLVDKSRGGTLLEGGKIRTKTVTLIYSQRDSDLNDLS